jgi:hypothetical protein
LAPFARSACALLAFVAPSAFVTLAPPSAEARIPRIEITKVVAFGSAKNPGRAWMRPGEESPPMSEQNTVAGDRVTPSGEDVEAFARQRIQTSLQRPQAG